MSSINTRGLVAPLAGLILLMSAQSGAADMLPREIDEATDTSAATMAAITPALQQQVPNYKSLSFVDEANAGVERCVAVFAPKNLGDLQPQELAKLRECVAQTLQTLIDKMEALKTLQRNSAFDYAVLSEAARLIADEEVPAGRAFEAVSAMLQNSLASATNTSQRVFLARFSDFTQTVVATLGG